MKIVFHSDFASLKNPFQNLILSPVWYIFHFSRNSCISSHKTHREVRWKMKFGYCLADVKILWYIKIVFSMRVMQLFFTGYLCELLPLRNFCGQNFLKGNLFKFFWKKFPGETLCKFFPIFPPKVLVFKR